MLALVRRAATSRNVIHNHQYLNRTGNQCASSTWTSCRASQSLATSYRSTRKFVTTTDEPRTAEVTDNVIRQLAAKPLHPLTLADLVRHGRPPLTATALFQTANFALSILPARLAHRIQSIRNLPYIVVSNPHISQIHDNYVHSLSTILPFAERTISTAEEEERFTDIMAGLVQRHNNTIPVLARGFLESRKYINASFVTRFLDEHLRARIGTRLIAEQQLALHYASQPPPVSSPGIATSSDASAFPSSSFQDNYNYHYHYDDPATSTYIGIIDTALRPASIIRSCESFVAEICELRYGVRPTVVITGDLDTRIAHIPVHLEYIITELLKNAFRAVIEQGNEREPIEITIAPVAESSVVPLANNESTSAKKQAQDTDFPISQQKRPSATPSEQSNKDTNARSSAMAPLSTATPGLTIRLRDRGGGISPANYANLFTYGFTTFNEHQASDAAGVMGMDALNVISGPAGGGSTLAGLGYGLPLGRAYAEYFGGGIAVQSLWGWGTDVYLTLKGVGKAD